MKALMFTTAILLATAATAQTYGTQSTTTTSPDATMTTTTTDTMTTDTTVAPDATMTTTTTMVPTAAAPAIPNSGQQVAPSNADPEHDARGIAVISDPATVPTGFNSPPGMGGPLVDASQNAAPQPATESYPACSRTVTDNCVQTYERGRR